MILMVVIGDILSVLLRGRMFDLAAYVVVVVVVVVVVAVVVLTLSCIIKSVVTGQAPVSLEWRSIPGKKHKQAKRGTRIYHS